mgnify:CR=1 FL=1
MVMESITLLPSFIVIGIYAGILVLTLVIIKFLSSGGIRRSWWPSSSSSSSSLPAPPGPRKWALPILGDLPYLMFMTRHIPMHQALYKMSKQYGPLMELRLGTAQRILVVSSASAARLILQTHDKIFSSRAPNIATSILHGSPANNISFAEPGPKWRLLRRICTNELFAPKCLLAFR